MATGKGKNWKSFEDAFRTILDVHHEFFGLANVLPTPGRAAATSGYIYDTEVIGHAKGDHKSVLFECRRRSRNLEPKDAGELAYRIGTTGAGKGYFVTTLDKGLAAGAATIADFEGIEHIHLSADATPHDYVVKYLNNFFGGTMDSLALQDAASYEKSRH